MSKIKIGFLGPPCSGKSTVAQHFVSKLRYKTDGRVELISEFAREFVMKFGNPTVLDQLMISTEQIERESAFSKEHTTIVTDSPSFLSLVYSHLNMNWSDRKQQFYHYKLQEFLGKHIHSYDALFMLPPIEMGNFADGGRVQTDIESIRVVDNMIRAFVALYKVPVIEMSGTLDDVVDGAIQHCSKHFTYIR